MSGSRRLDPVRAWAAAVGAIAAVLVVGSLLAPRLVYDRFVWKYFWGPVYADAHGAGCAVKVEGGVELYATKAACSGVPTGAKVGYTLVNEVGYMVTLLLAIVGVVFLLRRLELGTDRRFFFALLPYMFLGGALRVVEDANDAVPAGVEAAIAYPWNALIISPVIYFTVFGFTLAMLLGSVRLAATGWTDDYERPLAGAGTAALAVSLGYLLWMASSTPRVGFYPQVAGVVLVATTALTAAVWYGLERFWPAVNAGTGTMGVAVIWAHTLDGVANVVGIDWGAELGLPYGDLVPKHPVNRALIAVGEQFPAALTDLVGTAWPFLVVKVLAAVFVLYLFDEPIFEESPRYAVLLLVAIVAVGLGPGTRDMLRATFGV
ncbi:MAG: DUF63 family protein [Halobacteriales archaeon]